MVYSLTRSVWVLRQTQATAVPHPVKQGLIQSLGVFFDTMLVCTTTAIMILLYSGLKFGENAPQGVQVTQSALNEHLGSN